MGKCTDVMKITCRAFFYLKVCLRINDETKRYCFKKCGSLTL